MFGKNAGDFQSVSTPGWRKLRSSYGILTDERNSYVLLQRKRLNGTETWTWKPGVSDGRCQSAGVGARDSSAGNLSLKKLPRTFPIRASDSCRKLLTAEIVRQTNAWCTARVLECSDRFYLFHSLKSGKNNFSLYKICVEFPFSTPYWIEHFMLNFSFYPPCRVAYTVQIVFSSVLNSVEDTLVECQLNTIEIIQSFSFHLFISGVQSLWNIVLT